MIRGWQSSRSGMAWEQTRSDLIGNNVANVNTDGFKRQMVVGEEFGQMLLRRMGDQGKPATLMTQDSPLVGRLGHGARVAEVQPDRADGALELTGRALDMAIVGSGEFIYQGAAGPGYTRNGSFHRDLAGRLVTPEGYPVLVGGAPVGEGAAELAIESDGSIRVDGRTVGRPDLRGATPETNLMAGALERSNVDLAVEMTDLITAVRSFQANQRALQMQDETLAKVVTEVGRV